MTRKTRVLIADDESIIRMGLQVMLRDLGYEVAGLARDGLEAVDLAREKHPDIAILDIKMPRMDGLEAAAAISQICPIPIVILTAFSDREYVERAKSTAVHAYLVKPVEEGKLMPTLELAQARFAEQQTLVSELQTLEQTLQDRDLIDQAKRLLMEQLGLTETEAFQKIHRQARNSRTPMRDIAQDILQRYGAG